MTTRLALFFLPLVVVGCVNLTPIQPTFSQRVLDSSRPGIEQQKAIGDTMVEIGKVRFQKQITFVANAEAPISALWPHTYPNVMQGDVFSCQFITEEGAYVCSRPGWTARAAAGFGTPRFNSYLMIDRTGTGLGIAQGEGGSVYRFTEPIRDLFSYQEVEVPLTGSFRKELLYNGKSGNTIKLTYREFKNDMARPAFYQNLEYDLAESREIGFRDIRITVIEATNTFIRFMVK